MEGSGGGWGGAYLNPVSRKWYPLIRSTSRSISPRGPRFGSKKSTYPVHVVKMEQDLGPCRVGVSTGAVGCKVQASVRYERKMCQIARFR